MRVPTKVSVGPDHQPPPTKIRVGPIALMPPTTIYVPPVREKVQHGEGITIKIDDEHDTDDEDMDTDDESDNDDEDDEEEPDPDVFDVLVDIATTFNYLKDLRKQYRDILHQLKEIKQNDMGCFLQLYSHVKTTIIEEQDGLEGKQHGKGLTESEDETDEETHNDDNGNDTDTESDNDTKEETVDSDDDDD